MTRTMASTTTPRASTANSRTTPSALAQLQHHWERLAPRERRGLTIAAWVLGLGLVWWLALSPALQTLRSAGLQRVQLDAQLQQMLGLQAEAKTLQSSPKLTGSDALRALELSVKQRLGNSAQLNVVGDRATVTLKGTAPDALAQWLAQARVNAHALPVEAKLTRSTGAAPGGAGAASSGTGASMAWDGSVVLRLP